MKKILSWLLICFLSLSLASCGNNVVLNEEEQQAYECVVAMKSMMKDPDSFKLYDSMYMLQIYDKEGTLLVTYTIFKYGGANSYGAVVTDEAVFRDGNYLMDYTDEADPESDNYEEQLYFKVDINHYETFKALGKPSPLYDYNFLELDVEKIKSKMGLE